MLKWGVIGCGGIADRRTIPEGILPSARCELSAVMDINRDRAARVASKYNVPRYFDSVDDLLSIPEIQVVYIASPNDCHKDQIIAAANAGKHVLVEKPIALSIADAETAISACRRSGVKLMAGYMMRFHALHVRLQAMIQNGELGQVVFGRTQLTCWYPPILGAWRQDALRGGGGAWMDMGTHCVDLLEMWMGTVSRLFAFSSTLTHDYPVDDTTTVLVEFESGAQGVVEVNFNVPDDAAQNSLEIRGTKGVVVGDHTIGQGSGGRMKANLSDQENYAALQERPKAEGSIPLLADPVNPYRGEIEHFVDCIELDQEPMTGAEPALHNLKVVLAAYESARLGKAIDIS
jgi:predicted dehydrogenase